MINYKQTIKNFSKILPTADLDMLFKLMDAIVEEKLLNFQQLQVLLTHQ